LFHQDDQDLRQDDQDLLQDDQDLPLSPLFYQDDQN
jgi:hypothetical protein